MKLSEIKFILEKEGIFPSKGLGQHFLIDDKVFSKIIKASELKNEDFVLEVGPGIGNLTIKLAKKVKEVIAIEKDKRMSKILEKILKEKKIKNVRVFNDDILNFLKLNLKLLWPKYKVVSNIPYYLTSRLIRNFLELKKKPEMMVLMVQKEVAKRICAKPPKMNLLAVSVQFYAKPEIVAIVPKSSFWPRPKVDSAILKISKIKKRKGAKKFFSLVKVGFSSPRKQLLNVFSKSLKIDKLKVKEWLIKCGISPNWRAENLQIKDWLKLLKNPIL